MTCVLFDIKKTYELKKLCQSGAKPLGFPFVRNMMVERGDMIWMDKVCPEMGLLGMKWRAQFPDFDPIEKLLCIIKIRFSHCYHIIHSIEEMKEGIKEEWERLTEEIFRKCIE